MCALTIHVSMEDAVNTFLTTAITDINVTVQLELGVNDVRKISMNATIILV